MLMVGISGPVGQALMERLRPIDPALRLAGRTDKKGRLLRPVLAGPPVQGLPEDRPQRWAKALHGTDRLVILALTDIDPGWEADLVGAAQAAGVPRIIRVSPAFPDLRRDALAAHAAADGTVVAAGGVVLRVPPTYQDLFALVASPSRQRVFIHPFADGEIPFIDARDIALAVAHAATRPGLTARIEDVTGPESLEAHLIGRMLAAEPECLEDEAFLAWAAERLQEARRLHLVSTRGVKTLAASGMRRLAGVDGRTLEEAIAAQPAKARGYLEVLNADTK